MPALQAAQLPYSFVRLQSSLCEAQAMEKLVLELDANLLVALSLGHDCFVIDYASRNKKRGVPRALWCAQLAPRPGLECTLILMPQCHIGMGWSL